MTDIKKKIVFIIALLIFLQSLLIAHRVSFDFNILINFFKKDVAINQSVKNISAVKIKEFFEINNIKQFHIDESLENDVEFFQRIIEYSYPIKFDNSLKIIISKKIKIDGCEFLFKHKFRKVHECK